MVKIVKPNLRRLIGLRTGRVIMARTPLDDTLLKTSEERHDRINTWKRKLWLNFCTKVMETDERFTLYPVQDFDKSHMPDVNPHYNTKQGLLSDLCLRRTGDYHDVFLLQPRDTVGVIIYAGSRTQKVRLTCKPSLGMVIPCIEMSDELEQQYNDEVKRASINEQFLKRKQAQDGLQDNLIIKETVGDPVTGEMY